MRRASPAALALLLGASGCGSGGTPAPPGKGPGEACASASECRAGLFCFAGSCAASYAAASSCPPSGASPAPVAGADVVATAPQVSCPVPVAAPVFPSAFGGVVDLGPHRVGDVATFDVPPDTVGFSIVEQYLSGPTFIVWNGHVLPNTPVPTDVTLPPTPGGLFFSDTIPTPSDARGYPDFTGMLGYYLGYAPVTGVFTVPGTSASIDLVLSGGEIPPGTWSFVVNDWAYECATVAAYQPDCSGGSTASTYRVHVLTHSGASTAPALRSTGTLDLEVYLATSSTTFAGGAAAAASDAHVVRLVQTMRTYYARAGICIGAVTFHDLPAWAKLSYAPSGIVDIGGSPPCDALSQLFTLATQGTGPAVHLFLADELLDTSGGVAGYTTLGVDGSIPGPSGMPGTVAGGAIVGLFDQLGFELAAGSCSGDPDPGRCGADLIAYVAAHETGHWLGLYHTAEATGDFFDPLSDTATCACMACAPVYLRGACSEMGASIPTLMENRFCSSSGATCGGGRNLMFWLVDERLSRGDLTREQGEVMRQNPAVR